MVVRRSVNSFAAKQKRLPFVAKYTREDVLRPSDRSRLEAAIEEMAKGAEWQEHAGTRRDGWDAHIIRFDCPEKAKAMQAWLDTSGISTWPAPPRTEYGQLKVGG